MICIFVTYLASHWRMRLLCRTFSWKLVLGFISVCLCVLCVCTKLNNCSRLHHDFCSTWWGAYFPDLSAVYKKKDVLVRLGKNSYLANVPIQSNVFHWSCLVLKQEVLFSMHGLSGKMLNRLHFKWVTFQSSHFCDIG